MNIATTDGYDTAKCHVNHLLVKEFRFKTFAGEPRNRFFRWQRDRNRAPYAVFWERNDVGGRRRWTASDDYEPAETLHPDPQVYERQAAVHGANTIDGTAPPALGAIWRVQILSSSAVAAQRRARRHRRVVSPVRGSRSGSNADLWDQVSSWFISVLFKVFQLKSIIKRCLFRHVITPYMNLTRERPIALVGWSASLEMSNFDFNLCKNFIQFYARTGPERVFRDGQYNHLLIDKAKYVTNVIDEVVCPDMWVARCGNPERNTRM